MSQIGTVQRRRAVVLGRGFVGRAIEHAFLADDRVDEVVSVEPADQPDLVDRTADGARLLLDRLGDPSDAVLVNCCGRLRGTDAELEDANSGWPRWLTEVLMGSDTRLIHLGSASEYGDPGGAEPISERAPVHPLGIYGSTKCAGTSAVLEAQRAGLDAVTVRGFNLVAQDVSEASPLHQFRADVQALPAAGGEVTLWDPTTVRDFILLDDLARVVVALAGIEHVPDVVNACSGVGISFGSIIDALATETGRQVTVTSLHRPGIPTVIGDPTLMRNLTGVDVRMDATLLARTLLGSGVTS